MKSVQHLILFLCLFSACHSGQVTEQPEATFSGEKFQQHIRTTAARTPEQERMGFQLPEGFEIQLYASEPDIGKPLNIAFDNQGRLWVTQSHEYPFPAEPGEGADKLSVLEDTDGDGKADTFIHYEDTLNIPIGVLPLSDQTFAYSIPNLYRFTDTNADTKADRSEPVLGEFGHTDTHGMVNNLTRGYDGWIYTCHGFTNTSTIAGTDGDSITMTSGNTFRFLPDGSRVEQNTFGQVNPFGLAFDEWGYLYSTDCHTSPIYQLIRGADYPHFGKKEVGIGFGPDTKRHGEESTALSGLALYEASQFPEEYQHNFFIGDVVTCRIHRNSFHFEGSTPIAEAEEDFVKSDDPWFRPVDIKLGPDGALYVADFYNSIIGHYEVPLDHPKRDKVRGRIWRITYKGNDQPADVPKLAAASVEELITTLENDNLFLRMTAADELADRLGDEAIEPLAELLQNPETGINTYTLALWDLYRLGALSNSMIQSAANHSDAVIRTHAMRILREMQDTDEKYYPLIVEALQDESLHVQRSAVEALGNYPFLETVEQLLNQQDKIPDSDTHYQYTTRLMLRDLLRDENMLQQVVARNWNDTQTQALADVMTGVDLPEVGRFLFAYLQTNPKNEPHLVSQFQHAARFVPASQVSTVISLASQQSEENLEQGVTLFQAVKEGLVQRGHENFRVMRSWGSQLAEQLFDQYLPSEASEATADTKQLADESAKQLTLAVALAGDYRLSPLAPAVKTVLQDPSAAPNVKVAAARALLQIAPEEHALVQQLLEDEAVENTTKRNLIGMLGEMSPSVMIPVLQDVNNLPPDLQRDVALALAATPETQEVLFQKVQAGNIFARALVDPKVKERLLLNISDQKLQRFEEITANVPAVNEERNELIENRLTHFTEADSLAEQGVMVFNRNCKTCHRVSNEGGMIGPQLTGIGNWGQEALATKILDPNRNISEAFRTYTIKTKDGKVMTGLFRREEGEALVFANMNGEEFSVAKNNIEEQKASQFTLMPDHFGEVLSQQDFNALLSYLLSMQS